MKLRSVGATRRAARALPALLLVGLACMVSEPVVREPQHYVDLTYKAQIAEHRGEMLRKYEARDNSYVLSLLDYALVSLYDGAIDSARQAFTAAYKVDDGLVNEAAKFYQWLVVDGRTVYRLTKRERELVHFYLGLAYLLDSNLEESLVEFKKLRQLDQEASTLSIVDFYMGLVYEKLEAYDDALLEYNRLRGNVWTSSPRFSAGTRCYPGAEDLVQQVERLRDSLPEVDTTTVELVVQVDHQFWPSSGRTVVYADGEEVATLLPYIDCFTVKLSEAEISRKAAQEAGAVAARTGLRCCGTLLAEHFLGRGGRDVADLAGDVVLGEENKDKETRFWNYAPVAFSVLRLRIPAATREVELAFYGRDGDRKGRAVFPANGEEVRARRSVGMLFILAGLAPEFYVYQ